MRVCLSVWLICGIGLAAQAARAEEGHDEPVHVVEPAPPRARSAADELVLGGHFFQLPALQRSPFITTYFSLRQGFQTIDSPDAPVRPGRTYGVDALGVVERIDAGFEFLKVLQLTIGVDAAAYSGNGFKSVVVGGAGYSYRGHVGAGARIFRGSSTQLTARASLEAGNADQLQTLTLINALITQPQQSIDQIIDGTLGRLIVNKANRTAENLSFHLAQSFGPALGLQLEAGLEHANIDVEFFSEALARADDTSVSFWTPDFAVAVGLDLKPLVPVLPISVMGEYSITSAHASSDLGSQWLTTSQRAGVGVYYSGRPELALGLSAYRTFSVETTEGFNPSGNALPGGRPRTDTVLLTLGYTW